MKSDCVVVLIDGWVEDALAHRRGLGSDGILVERELTGVHRIQHPWEPMRVDNVARVRDAFRAFAERDSITVGRLIGNEVVWRVPGLSAMAGEYRGRAEIFEFLRRTGELTSGTYRTEVVDVWGGDELVVALYRAVGSRDGRELDITQALVFRFEGNALLEVLAVPSDPAAFDAFWG
jgi:ketosteroid isomerase-like protein